MGWLSVSQLGFVVGRFSRSRHQMVGKRSALGRLDAVDGLWSHPTGFSDHAAAAAQGCQHLYLSLTHGPFPWPGGVNSNCDGLSVFELFLVADVSESNPSTEI